MKGECFACFGLWKKVLHESLDLIYAVYIAVIYCVQVLKLAFYHLAAKYFRLSSCLPEINHKCKKYAFFRGQKFQESSRVEKKTSQKHPESAPHSKLNILEREALLLRVVWINLERPV